MVIQECLTTAIRPGTPQRAPQGAAPGTLDVGTWQVREPGSVRGGRLETSGATEGGAGALRLGGGRMKEDSVPVL